MLCSGEPRPAYAGKNLRETSVKTGIFLRFFGVPFCTKMPITEN